MEKSGEKKGETKILEIIGTIPVVNVILLGGYGIYALIRATKRGFEAIWTHGQDKTK